MSKKTFVRYIFFGKITPSFVPKEVDSRDPHQLDIPDGVVALQFVDGKKIIENEAGQNIIEEAENKSKLYYYYEKEILTLEEIYEKYPNKETLHENLKRLRKKWIKT